MNKKFTQAFTLVEVLAVMVIIMIVAGLFVGVSGPASQSAKKRKAEVMISALEVAIGMYHADTGEYPPTDAGSGCANLYDYLTNSIKYSAGGTSPKAGWSGPYMEFKTEDKGTISASTQIKDPWWKSPFAVAHAYNYQTPGTYNTNSFDLWSNGPDGKNGTAAEKVDNIINW